MGTVEMNSSLVLEGKDGVMQPLSLETSFQNVSLKSDSEIQADTSESVSCTTECDDKVLINNGSGLSPPNSSMDSDTVETSSAFDQSEDSEMLSASQTPRERTFDPFAPGPEVMALAPNPKRKVLHITRVPLRRRLMFDLVSDPKEEIKSVSSDEEDPLLESISKSLLELILSNQAKEVSDGHLAKEDSFEDLKTPTSVPFLTGISDVCPAAPTRPVLKVRKLEQSISRKLEFRSNLN